MKVVHLDNFDDGAKFANLNIGGAIFFCVVTLLYFIYFYYWTHERYFTSRLSVVLENSTIAKRVSLSSSQTLCPEKPGEGEESVVRGHVKSVLGSCGAVIEHRHLPALVS